MNKVIGILVIGLGFTTIGCKKEDVSKQQTADHIEHQSLDLTINGTGEQVVEIPYDGRLLFKFSIINLKEQNDQWDEQNTDTLAAVLQTNYAEILDNSEYGYLDALERDAVIGPNSGHWNQRAQPSNYALSTSWNTGEFKGTGNKFIGFRLQKDSDYIYGWFLVNCTEKSDQLEIKNYGFNKTAGNTIKAGQE